MKVVFLWSMRFAVLVLLVLWAKYTLVAAAHSFPLSETVGSVALFALTFAVYGYAAWFNLRSKK